MNKYISLIALLIIVSLGACAQKKVSKLTAKGLSYARYERTACFGRCPAYMVEVYTNGLMRYTGRQFTEYTGVYEKNIGTAKAQSILKKYAANKVDTCRDIYDNVLPDVPGLNYVFTINGKEKNISNAGFGPKFLEALAVEVDKVAKPDKTWKKIRDLKLNE
jgi:hypothetical protein